MKKSFLIAGLIAGLTSTNGYADVVISQTDESPDITISVARAAKIKPRVSPFAPINTEAEVEVGSGGVLISCPQDCSVDCHDVPAVGGIKCFCRTSNGELCQEEVTVRENTIHKTLNK